MNVQLAPGARLTPQLFVWIQLSVMVMLEIARLPVPVFWRVTDWDALVVPAG